ncbi:MAG: nucleotidyl transferase AbiEii/AbiGii toxin family protein [Candidatus Aenigmarchaeota archaeon]|nr:nucleotidyl transferase AbiEii/AbiGii toxin family protein [Candidatus Aenigmarchaeota archaeon]
MGEIKLISENRLKYLAGLKGFNLIYLEKDYFLTVLLYLIKDVEDIVFKGGTALNKIFLNHTRLSEDLDFVCRKNVSMVKNEIVKILQSNKEIFSRFAFENETPEFFRVKVFYRGFFSKSDYVILDVNGKGSVLLPPEKRGVPHFYEEIPKFVVAVLNPEELVAEKIRALVMRNQPRDYFDVYVLLKAGYKINFELVKKKLKEAGQDFEPERIFKNAQKVYSRWDSEITQLTNKPEEFVTVIKRLEKEFRKE